MYEPWFVVREPGPPGYGDDPGKQKQGARWRLVRNVRLLRVMRGWSQEVLAREEYAIVRSQFVISKGRGGRRYMPYVFPSMVH